MPAPDETPEDIDKLRATLAAEQAARREALVLQLKLLIAKLKHDKFGASAERGRKLIDHLELQLDELVTAASEAAAIAEKPAPTNATADRPAPPARRSRCAQAQPLSVIHYTSAWRPGVPSLDSRAALRAGAARACAHCTAVHAAQVPRACARRCRAQQPGQDGFLQHDTPFQYRK